MNWFSNSFVCYGFMLGFFPFFQYFWMFIFFLIIGIRMALFVFAIQISSSWIRTSCTTWRSAVAPTTCIRCLVTSRSDWLLSCSRNVQNLLTILPVYFTVCLHGRHSKAHGAVCLFYNGTNWAQDARRHHTIGHIPVFLSLLNVQSWPSFGYQCELLTVDLHSMLFFLFY